MTPGAETHQHQRWRIVNGCLRERSRIHEAGAGEDAVEERLIAAYLDYQVNRRLFQYLVAGTGGEAALAHLIDVVVQLAFCVTLSQDRDQLEDTMNVRSRISVAPAYARSNEGVGLGGLHLGSSSALGSSGADAGPVVRVDVALGDKQISRLYRHPWALSHIVRAIDSVVPIDLDFTIRFGLRPNEGEFRLAGGADKEGEGVPILGLTTALARQTRTAEE